VPDTEEMLMITPPSPACMWWLARCATCIGASRFNLMIASLKRGDAVAASASGAPPALLITTSSPPVMSIAWRIAALTLVSLVTSISMTSAPACCSSRAALALRPARSRTVPMTRCPRRSSANVIKRPNPPAAPVRRIVAMCLIPVSL